MLTMLLQLGLFCWFILSVYLVAKDSTLSLQLKIIGEITNFMALGYIASNMIGENHSILFYTVGILLLGWYLYYTPQDIVNNGYTPAEKITYVIIDISMLIYLISSLTIAFCTSTTNTYSIIYKTHLFKSIGFSWF